MPRSKWLLGVPMAIGFSVLLVNVIYLTSKVFNCQIYFGSPKGNKISILLPLGVYVFL